MAVATISVNFATAAEVRAGTTAIKSVNPLQLFNALTSGNAFYSINVSGAQFNNNVTIATGSFSLTDATKTATLAGVTSITNSTPSTTTGTGALVVTGGVGIGGRLNVGAQTIISTGGLTVAAGGLTVSAGGASITGDSSITSGTLTVASGLTVSAGGATITAGGLTVTAGGATITAGGLTVNAGATSSITSTNISLVGTTQVTGALNVTGDVTAFFSSDSRLKDNREKIPSPLEKIKKISGISFDWNKDSGKSGKDYGVIAQEIEQIMPEIVTTREDGYKAVRYEKLIPLLIEAIKELAK